MNLNLIRATAIEKGCSIADFKWLAEMAAGKQRIVELGTFHGRSTRAMLDNSDAHIWCIDHWQGSRPGVSHGLIADDRDFEIFLENISDARDRVTILKMSTCDAIGLLPKDCFDMAFIDADHSYEAIWYDIVLCASLLREGGLLCGHDRSWDGVKRAVDELIMHPREGGAEVWWTTRKKGWMYEVAKVYSDDVYYTTRRMP